METRPTIVFNESMWIDGNVDILSKMRESINCRYNILKKKTKPNKVSEASKISFPYEFDENFLRLLINLVDSLETASSSSLNAELGWIQTFIGDRPDTSYAKPEMFFLFDKTMNLVLDNFEVFTEMCTEILNTKEIVKHADNLNTLIVLFKLFAGARSKVLNTDVNKIFNTSSVDAKEVYTYIMGSMLNETNMKRFEDNLSKVERVNWLKKTNSELRTKVVSLERKIKKQQTK